MDVEDGTSPRAPGGAPHPTGLGRHDESSTHRGGLAEPADHVAQEAEHLAHYAHQLHLAAEGIEYAAHRLHKAIHFVEHAKAAAKLLKTHSQMAWDLRRMRRNIVKLTNVSKDGGPRGAKAAEDLVKAREALEDAQAAFRDERVAVRLANDVVRDFKVVQSGIKGTAVVRLAQAASRFETALHSSAVGRGLLSTGRIVGSKAFIRGLVVVGSAAEAVASYSDSPAQTTSGKAANALLGAGGGALTMANPVVAGADLLAPKGYKLSEVYHGGAAAVTSIGEGVLTGDTTAMDEFHRRSMEGSYGKVMQAASEAGEYWAKEGVVGGLNEFAHSVSWWVSH